VLHGASIKPIKLSSNINLPWKVLGPRCVLEG
jgi:hypothetical protein